LGQALIGRRVVWGEGRFLTGFQDRPDLVQNRPRVERFRNDGGDSKLLVGLHFLRLHLGGYGNDRDLFRNRIVAESAEGGDPVHLGHHDVQQDEVGQEGLRLEKAFAAAAGQLDGEAADVFQGDLGDRPDVELILDLENSRKRRTTHGPAPLEDGDAWRKAGWFRIDRMARANSSSEKGDFESTADTCRATRGVTSLLE
jgi:hypothetical protein